jgi:hypothetical protein
MSLPKKRTSQRDELSSKNVSAISTRSDGSQLVQNGNLEGELDEINPDTQQDQKCTQTLNKWNSPGQVLQRDPKLVPKHRKVPSGQGRDEERKY